MVWQIIDVRSNLLGEFPDESSALAAVRELIAAEPDVTDEIGLLGWDEDGNPLITPALTGEALRAAVDEPSGIQGPRAA